VTKVGLFVHNAQGGRAGAAAPPGVGCRLVFQRFTERARHVVVFAQEEARAFKHNYIGTEHILLGLLREEEGVAARVLGSLEITVDKVRDQIGQIVGYGEEATMGQIPFTPRAKKVLELALREALRIGHNYIGTEHILLGLVRENDGVAAQIMLALGADDARVRDEVLNVLGPIGVGSATAGRARRWRRPRPELGSVAMVQNCWEYRVEHHEAVDVQQLNDLGAEGWELVSVDRSPAGVELIFKRRGPMPGSLRAAG
jgi:ATP-dependent Clp protease ATP-binding subunit ClpA